MPRGRANLRYHGAADGHVWRHIGHALCGRIGDVAAWRHGPDVPADERISLRALAKADRQSVYFRRIAEAYVTFHTTASHSGANGGRTKRWSFGRAAIAARSSSSREMPSASRLAFWLSGRPALGIAMTPSWSNSQAIATCAAVTPCLRPMVANAASFAARPCARGA